MACRDYLLTLVRQGDWTRVEAASLTCLNADPNDHFAWYIAGVSAHQLGRHAAAVERLKRSVELNDTDTDYRNNLGVALAHTGKLAEAITAYERVLAVQPDRPDTLYNISHALLQAGEANRSVEYLRDLLRQQPRAVPVRMLLVQCLLMRRDGASASALLTELMADAEDRPELWIDIGNGLVQCEHFDKARLCFERAVETENQHSQALTNLGNLLAMTGKPEEGIRCLTRALSVNDGAADTLSNLACAYDACAEPAKAEPYHRRALDAAPHHPHFNLNYAIHLLRAGEITRALPHYQFRFDHPEWAGELLSLRLAGGVKENEQFMEQTLVLGEQGLGDEVFLLQCLGQHARPATWSYAGDDRLKNLFERSFPEASFFPRSTTNLESIIAGSPHAWRLDHVLSYCERVGEGAIRPALQADDRGVARWRGYLVGLDARPKVGISWTGGKHRKDRIHREISPRLWTALSAFSGVCFIDIQYDDRPYERAELTQALGHPVHRPGAYDPMSSPDDCGALLLALDLIITADNSTAHLAGALGAQTWVLLAKVPDWRWGTDAFSFVPYPRVQTYRQQTLDEWDGPLRMLARDLAIELDLVSR